MINWRVYVGPMVNAPILFFKDMLKYVLEWKTPRPPTQCGPGS